MYICIRKTEENVSCTFAPAVRQINQQQTGEGWIAHIQSDSHDRVKNVQIFLHLLPIFDEAVFPRPTEIYSSTEKTSTQSFFKNWHNRSTGDKVTDSADNYHSFIYALLTVLLGHGPVVPPLLPLHLVSEV